MEPSWAGRGRVLLVLGAILLAAPILPGLVLLGTADRQPRVQDTPAVTSGEKRRLAAGDTRDKRFASPRPTSSSRYLNIVAVAGGIYCMMA